MSDALTMFARLSTLERALADKTAELEAAKHDIERQAVALYAYASDFDAIVKIERPLIEGMAYERAIDVLNAYRAGAECTWRQEVIRTLDVLVEAIRKLSPGPAAEALAELRRDAARYRWLKRCDDWLQFQGYVECELDALDAAIDSAREDPK